MISANKLIEKINEFRETQGLDRNHWKRKESYKAHIQAMIYHKIPFGKFEEECLQYLKDDGENISAFEDVIKK